MPGGPSAGAMAKTPPPCLVEQRAEDRRRVEARHARPDDRAVLAHQRRDLAVPDQAEVVEHHVASITHATVGFQLDVLVSRLRMRTRRALRRSAARRASRRWRRSATWCWRAPPAPGSSAISRLRVAPGGAARRQSSLSEAWARPRRSSRRSSTTSPATSRSSRRRPARRAASSSPRPTPTRREFPCAAGARARRARRRRRHGLVDRRRLGARRAGAADRRARWSPRLGTVVLVHDVSFLAGARRPRATFSWWRFLVVSLIASAVTLVMTRFAWREWTLELAPRAARATRTRELRAARARRAHLVEQLCRASARRRAAGRGAPQRLRATLNTAPAGRAHRHPRQPRALHSRCAGPTGRSRCSTRRAAW